MAIKPAVLFVCIHNSARSQMAEAFLKDRCPDQFIVESAGIEPGALNELAVEAMREVEIDISRNKTKSALDLFKSGRHYAWVITVCDEASAEQCPTFPGVSRRLHWNFADPSALEGSRHERLVQTRMIRDQIRAQVDAWCGQNCEPERMSA